jgi:hypothetical protein
MGYTHGIRSDMKPWSKNRAWLAREMWIDGCSYTEIAEALGTSRSAVGGFINRTGLQRYRPVYEASLEHPHLERETAAWIEDHATQLYMSGHKDQAEKFTSDMAYMKALYFDLGLDKEGLLLRRRHLQQTPGA